MFCFRDSQWLSQVAEQYPTWPNTQSFLQMIRQEVTPDRANFSLPGSCHGCAVGFRDVVEMWHGWIGMNCTLYTSFKLLIDVNSRV